MRDMTKATTRSADATTSISATRYKAALGSPTRATTSTKDSMLASPAVIAAGMFFYQSLVSNQQANISYQNTNTPPLAYTGPHVISKSSAITQPAVISGPDAALILDWEGAQLDIQLLMLSHEMELLAESLSEPDGTTQNPAPTFSEPPSEDITSPPGGEPNNE